MSPDRWVRPLTFHEEAFHSLYKLDTMKISYAIRLGSTEEITDSVARKVFLSLCSKNPALRMYIQEKEDKLWYREMSKPKIDFQVIEDADIFQEYHKLVHREHGESGPLWAVRLLPASPRQTDFINKTKLETPVGGMPFMTHVVMAFHHGIMDGFSCHQIIKQTLNLFEDVFAGREIDDTLQTSILIDPEQEAVLMSEVKKEFDDGVRSLEERTASYLKVSANCLFPKGYSLNIKEGPETICVLHNLARDTTQSFIRRCKKEGMTVHSGFTAALDAAYVKLLLDGNVHEDEYNVTAMHCINHRRFYKNSDTFFGNGMGLMDTSINVPKDIFENFWTHARKVHGVIKAQIDAKNSIEQFVLGEIDTANPFDPMTEADIKIDSLPKMIHYATSNMLDVSKTFTVPDRSHVCLEWYDRLTSLQVLPVLFYSVFQTYHGQLMHSLQYNSKIMTSQVAQKFSDNIFEVIGKVV